MQLKLSLLLLVLGVFACAWAYPNPLLTFDDEPATQLLAGNYDWAPSEQVEQLRVRRQLNVQGGGSPRQGFDLSVNGRAPVWQSPNGRHSLDATGQYSQHLGGPYGNSRPNWGAGAQYTFRF
ncbi:diptericin-D [Drosophila novamexicana]|uniref:diptericin-D n=1 Tax=Drosophila novamexicana TaxID=47314 RepID=UPI0011E5E11B|nr:diptericin-D [Drosophila novamexicana]